MLARLVVLSSVLLLACAQDVPEGKHHQVGAQSLPNNSQRRTDSSLPMIGLIGSDAKAAQAWKEFSNEGRYRIASKEDFKMSEDNYRPYGDGNFNRDDEYFDFAVIVVDTVRTDALRFGVVIFNARQSRQGYDRPFWLYRERDLSRTSLNTSSHGPLLVAEHLDDGSINICVVKWSLQKKEYACDKTRGWPRE
jgi:hypothetical protein